MINNVNKKTFRVKPPVVDHVSVVDYFSEKHEKYGF